LVASPDHPATSPRIATTTSEAFATDRASPSSFRAFASVSSFDAVCEGVPKKVSAAFSPGP
ncbi:MAG TPA: hypothetical protein PLG42_09960, partial [Bacteroidales bacterium]|nr:hypothetical protein [Bacteroidales bacterium]